MPILVSAFQVRAFQFTGFQEAGGAAGGGDILWFWYEMIARARAKRAIADKKKRKPEREDLPEPLVEPAYAVMRFVLAAPKPLPTTFLKRLLPVQKPLIDEATELAEFKQLMAFVQSLPRRMAKLTRQYRTVELSLPAHERPNLIALQDRLSPVIARFLAGQVPKIAHQIEQLKARFWKADLSDDEIDALDAVIAGIDFTGWAILAGDVEPVLAEATKDGAHEALRAVGFDTTTDAYDAVNQDALDYAEDRAAEMVGMKRGAKGKLRPNPRAEYQITESTRDDIRSLVGDALKEGWSTDTLAKALMDSNAFSAERAQLIARTEVIRASNQGTLQGFQASGVVLKKEWTTFDPCPICEENEEQGPIDLDEDFASGDDAPPAHPNCKCALVGLTALDTTETETEQ